MAPFHKGGSSHTLMRRTPYTMLSEEHSKVFPEKGILFEKQSMGGSFF